MLTFQALTWGNGDLADDFMIRVFGKTPEGKSVCVSIKGYKPYYFLKVPKKLKSIPQKWDVGTLSQYLKNDVNKRYPNIEAELVKKIPVNGWCNKEKQQYIKIICDSMKTFKGSQNYLFNKNTFSNTFKQQIWFELYESNMDPSLRFMHEREITPAGMISIEEYEHVDDHERESLCDIEIIAEWDCINPGGTAKKATPFIFASFDIECTSEDGSFPQPDRPGDQVIQIFTTFYRYGEKEPYKIHATVLGETSPLEDHNGIPVELHCSNNEKDVLMKWQKIMREVKPDILVGYNIHGFDLKYMWERSEKVRCNEDFSYLGKLINSRSKLIPKTFSSGAYGHTISNHLDMPGVLTIDLLTIMRREHKLESYKLDDVAEHYLKDNKLKVSPQDIFDLQKEGPDERKKIAEYCLQDTKLPMRLMIKLTIFPNMIEMANVTRVSMEWLMSRGQQIKVFSQLIYETRKRGLIIPAKVPHSNEGYVGATVLHAMSGAYKEPITGLDFAALYPTIMIANNFCYTTRILPKHVDKYLNMEENGHIKLKKVSWFKSVDIKEFLVNSICEILKKEKKQILDKYKEPIEDNEGNVIVPAKKGVVLVDVPLTFIFQKGKLDKFINSVKDRFNGIELDIDDIDEKYVNVSALSEYIYTSPLFPHKSDGTEENHDDDDDKKIKKTQIIKFPETHYFVQSWKGEDQVGLLPNILDNLLKERRKAKKEMNAETDPFKKSVLNGKQLALKVSCNSVYGFCGAGETGMLPCIPIASSVTTVGRQMIEKTTNLIEKSGKYPGAVVVYGDTDSTMVKFKTSGGTPEEQIKESFEIGIEAGIWVTEELNKDVHYKGKIDLEFEKVYYPYLLMSKKRYAGNMYEDLGKPPKIDIKGLQVVRRDNCPLVKIVCNGIIHKLLIELDTEGAKNIVIDTKRKLLNNEIDINDLILSKSLGNVTRYKNQNLPHLQVARNMAERDPGNAPRSGDRIAYVFKESEDPKAKQFEKAEDPKYVIENNLKLDVEYYLEHQIKNPVLDLLRVVDKNVEEELFPRIVKEKPIKVKTIKENVVKVKTTKEQPKKASASSDKSEIKVECVACSRTGPGRRPKHTCGK